MNIKRQIARFLLPGVLLLVVLGTIPKLYLHELFAHHTDETSCTHVHPGTPCMHQQGFSCQLYELVVNDIYLVPSPQLFEFSSIPYQPLAAEFCSTIFPEDHFKTTGRSPPALV